MVVNEEELSETTSRPSKCRKVVRKYDSSYLKYGFTWNQDDNEPRPQCVICCEVLANESMRPNKMIRHLETKHPDHKSKPLDFFENKMAGLKSSKKKLMHFAKVNEKAMHTSYLISLHIAKTGKPHTIGEDFFLPAFKEAVLFMYGSECAKEAETIPLSNNTVSRRIDEMSQWVEDQLIKRVTDSKVFALQLDESTDVQGACQLLVFVRYIWNNEPHEDMLFCEPILRGTSNEIFKTIDTYIRSKQLNWLNCVGVCTDGARAMCGKKSGVVTRIVEVSPKATWTHCSIHREALVCKSLSEEFQMVLNTSVKIVNFIKTKPLQARLFEKLCDEMGSRHKALLLHTEVRWLSRGKVLTRLVELRQEVASFLDEISDLGLSLRDENFVLKLTYLADIFSKLNELNLYLQGPASPDIFAVHDKIRAFMRKLTLWKGNVEARNFECFDSLASFIFEENVVVSDVIIAEISTHLTGLKTNFENYFMEEIQKFQSKMWIVNPFQDDITSGISSRADEELIDLSEDAALKNTFKRNKLIQFWVSVEEKAPTLSKDALSMLVPFSSSYLCEVGFSAMVGIKTKYRNKLQLSNSLRLKVTNREVDVFDVIKSNRKQAHSSHTPSYQN